MGGSGGLPLILGVVGAAIGGVVAGPPGAAVGFGIGSAAGAAPEQAKAQRDANEAVRIQGNQQERLLQQALAQQTRRNLVKSRDAARIAQENAQSAALGGYGGTILTGPQGIPGLGSAQGKTMLGA